MSERVRVYIACSLDGFIAGVNDDLSWLPGAAGNDEALPSEPTSGVGYDEFIGHVGAILMGRGTYDVVQGFGAWYYGDLPVLVATHRPLTAVNEHVRAVDGDVGTLVALAREAADGKDVYIDGGALIRQALDAGLIDELIVTFVPVAIGAGHPLFAGVEKRHPFDLVATHRYGRNMVQMVLKPAGF